MNLTDPGTTGNVSSSTIAGAFRRNSVATLGRTVRYWPFIQHDPGSFLSLHDSRRSRLFHSASPQSVGALIVRFFVQTARVIVHLARLGASGFNGAATVMPPAGSRWAMLVGVGAEKYRYEEDIICDEMRRHGLEPVVLNPPRAIRLRPGVLARATGRAMSKLVRLIWAAVSRSDRFAAALLAESTTSIFNQHVVAAWAEDLTHRFVYPAFVVSTMPGGDSRGPS